MRACPAAMDAVDKPASDEMIAGVLEPSQAPAKMVRHGIGEDELLTAPVIALQDHQQRKGVRS